MAIRTAPAKPPATLEVPWAPQTRQADLLDVVGLLDVLAGGQPTRPLVELLLYGGAAFGGKTDGFLGLAAVAAVAFPNCRIGFFRRTYPELEQEGGAIDRSKQIFHPPFATWNENQRAWTFFTGSRLRFCHAEHEDDVRKYLSSQFDILLIDQAESFTWKMLDFLFTRNRANVPGIVPFACLSANPGGIGHTFLKKSFVDGPANQVKRVQLPNGRYAQVVFLPALLDDNPIGVARDPGYEARLEQRDPVLYKAYRWGLWDIFEGQAFTEWNPALGYHVCKPFDIPRGWPRWRAVDWGFAHPFYVGWLARNPDIGRIYVYREITMPGLTDQQQARLIVEQSPDDEGVTVTYADPSMWARKSYEDIVTSTADEYAGEGVMLSKADNDRKSGKRKVHRQLGLLPDGHPGLQIFETCPGLIVCIPQMVIDPDDKEDVLKVDGDDPYDFLRYALTKVQLYGADPEEEKRRRAQRPPLTMMRGI